MSENIKGDFLTHINIQSKIIMVIMTMIRLLLITLINYKYAYCCATTTVITHSGRFSDRGRNTLKPHSVTAPQIRLGSRHRMGFQGVSPREYFATVLGKSLNFGNF